MISGYVKIFQVEKGAADPKRNKFYRLHHEVGQKLYVNASPVSCLGGRYI